MNDRWPPSHPNRKKAIFAGGAAVLAAIVVLVMLLARDKMTAFIPVRAPDVVVSSGTVASGQTLSTILDSHGLDTVTTTRVQTTLGKAFNLRRMRPGHYYELATSTNSAFRSFTYKDSPTHSYQVSLSSSGAYAVSEKTRPTEWRERFVQGEVKESLYKDLMTQGYNEPFVANLIADLADNIFAWRIDFFTEQRPGDTVEILLEQEFIIGTDQPLNNGRSRILAATYNGRATRHKQNYAFRFQPDNEKRAEYYDEKGDALRRAFLRAPFTHGAFRISSNFNPKRFHPILRVYKPHHGTDYAAARGTPVAAIGKGRVIFAGWKGGYGKAIEIRHSSNYVSRYGHLSKIAVKRGQSVHQGQYMGSVGSTGRSTGPHLHFEMLVNGKQRNFLTMSFPSASSVAKSEMGAFNNVRDNLMARLNASGTAQTASASRRDIVNQN